MNDTDQTGEKTYTACLIVIGNEILSGRTRDANLQYLGENLHRQGIRMTEARVIPDVEDTIVAAVNDARARFDYVFTTGGIGPTHDDITAAAVAKAVGRPLRRDPAAEAVLHKQYRPEDRTPERMKMADVPEGATLLDNPVSAAPGFQVGNVFVLPGVPRIMQAMFEGFRHRLAGGRPVLSRAVASHVQEGRMAAPLAELQAAHPDLEFGSYPFFRDGKPGASIVVRGTDPAEIDRAIDAVKATITGLGGEPIDDAH